LEYRNFKFIVAFDCEKQTNVGFSGLNTRAGDLITIKALRLKKYLNPDDVGTVREVAKTEPEFLHTTLEYDAILSISDAGVTVLE
jgi:acetylglutamate kinase